MNIKTRAIVLVVVLIVVLIVVLGNNLVEVMALNGVGGELTETEELDRLPNVDYQSDYLGKVGLVVVGYLIIPSIIVLGILYTIYTIIRGVTKRNNKKPEEKEKQDGKKDK